MTKIDKVTRILLLFTGASLTNASATLNVAGDYDFADNQAPAGFTEFGNPTYADGKLLLDGDGDYLQAPAPSNQTNNMVLEAIVSASAFGAFNFAASISNEFGAAGGYGLVAQGSDWTAITSGVGFPGAAAHGGAPTPAVALAYVRENGNTSLYVNGVKFDSGGSDNTPALSGTGVITLGGNRSDAPNGLFNGSIDRVRVSTFTGAFVPADLLGPTDGTAPTGVPFLVDPAVVFNGATSADASVTLVANPADVTLYWDTIDQGASFACAFSVTSAAETPGPVNRTLTGLADDTRYFLRFYAINTIPEPDGEAWSAAATFVTGFVEGQKVTDLAATAPAYDRIDLTWTDPFHTEYEFFLERSLDGEIWDALANLPPDTTTYSDTTVASDTQYFYRILGANQITGDSDFSNEAQTTTPPVPPFTPTLAGDYNFDDNQAPVGFTEFGDPTYAGGKLLLDGNGDYIQGPAPTTATDNIIFETLASADAFGGFNWVISISNTAAGNSGYGIVAQNGNWNALTSNIGFVGSDPHGAVPTPTVALAYVREKGNSSLYVNGVKFDSGVNDGAIQLSDSGLITIGGHAFDAPNGLFNGSIDRVRVTTFIGPFDPNYLLNASAPTGDFAAWIGGFDVGGMTGFGEDPDHDGLDNGLENFLGTVPSESNAGLTAVTSDGSGASFQHPQNPNPASDLAAVYEWSTDLATWNLSGAAVGGTTVSITATPDTPAAGTTSVSAVATGTVPGKLFLRIKVTRTP